MNVFFIYIYSNFHIFMFTYSIRLLPLCYRAGYLGYGVALSIQLYIVPWGPDAVGTGRPDVSSEWRPPLQRGKRTTLYAAYPAPQVTWTAGGGRTGRPREALRRKEK
jgi:hypothetical protein